MMENNLLACPFCGNEAIMYTRKQVGYPSGDKGFEACISCWHEGCGARVVGWALREEWAKESAITAWNTRPTPTPEALSLDHSEAKIAWNWFLVMSEQLSGHHHEDAELYYKLADYLATKPAKEGEG